ncbi:MAG: outer membrane lipid asymmetry maintenance protein MlaD [Deltaproteobacteria bacterium]|nr:outer membrane lipid asymmetry maintenance protein MlaD [Deltaproteobacteria bacterium]
MRKFNVETAVGTFVVAGFLCFAYLAIKLGDVHVFGREGYHVTARFSSVSGLKQGARVEIAGVVIGKVTSIRLADYQAKVDLQIEPDVTLRGDAIASIRTQGIIGDKFVKISPGGADEEIKDGGEILDTEGAISLEELISKYIFESKNK